MVPSVLNMSDKVKIEGESSVAGYEKQTDVFCSFHGLTMPMVGDKSSNSRTAGRCKHEDFVCFMKLNKAYPKLLEACANGSNIGKTELTALKMSEGKICEVLKFTLADVMVSDIRLVPKPESVSDDADTLLPWVRVSLNYKSFDVMYNEYDPTGASKGAVSAAGI